MQAPGRHTSQANAPDFQSESSKMMQDQPGYDGDHAHSVHQQNPNMKEKI